MKRLGFLLVIMFLFSMMVSVSANNGLRSRLDKIDLEKTGGNGTVYSNDELDLILRFLSKNYDRLHGRTTDEKFQDAMDRYEMYKKWPILLGLSLLVCLVFGLQFLV